MATRRIMFVSHTGQMSGAEMVLLDIVQLWPGASAFLFEDGPFAGALAERGLEVTVSRRGRGLATVRRDSSVFKIVPLLGRLGAIMIELMRAARNHDILYANSQKAFVLSSIVAMLIRRPLIWHLHDIINAAHFGALQRRIQVGLANLSATKVIVPSKAVATAFIAEGGRPDLVEIVANGLDLTPELRSPTELRHALGLPEGALVGVFSQLAMWKGQHILLQALARIPGVRCIVVGDALFGEKAYATYLAKLAGDLGIAERVEFLGQRTDVPKLMRAVDVVVHPSIDPEPFGRTLVEAMLVDVPVIATDAGAASDILESGRAGTLVPPNEPAALSAAIARVLNGSDHVLEQVDYARTRALSLYSRSRMLETLTRVIDAVHGGVPT